MAIQQVSVFVQNKPGALSAICKLLAESGVDMPTRKNSVFCV